MLKGEELEIKQKLNRPISEGYSLISTIIVVARKYRTLDFAHEKCWVDNTVKVQLF